MSSGISLPTYEELDALTKSLVDLDVSVSRTMSEVRRIQKWHHQTLSNRFDGINPETLKRYMQPSYEGMRPIHVLAAFSWVTMIPMTSFFKGLKVLEADRGMDGDALEAIIRCGRLSAKRFKWLLEILCDFHQPKSKEKYLLIEESIISEFGSLDLYDDTAFMPPEKLSITQFGDDYYYSIARALKDFRSINQLNPKQVAEALGLSMDRYCLLENESESKLNKPFSLHIGIRVRLAFHSHSHVEFTKYMHVYPQFHKLRVIQHIRDTLIVEALRYVPQQCKRSVINIMNEMASL